MASPAFVNVGSPDGAHNSSDIDVPYPSSISADNILFLHVAQEGGYQDVNTPSGWTKLFEEWVGDDTDQSTALFWKRATGSETGTVNVTWGSTDAKFGLISQWSGCESTGTPFSTPLSTYGTSDTASSSAITPGYDDNRVLCFICYAHSDGVGTLGGGNYSEDAEQAYSQGDDFTFAIDSFAQSTATTEAARTASLGRSENWRTYTLALYSSTGGGTQYSLEGSISAQSTLSGDLEAVRGLAGSISAQSTLSGDLTQITHILNQASFRWRYDNDVETSAAWRESANVNPSTIYPQVPYRLRFLIQETGGADGPSGGEVFSLYYNKNSGGWTKITETSPVAHICNGGLIRWDDTTQQLGAGSFISDNDGQIVEVSGDVQSGEWTLPATWTANYETEVEFCVGLDYDTNSNGDTFQFRVERADGTDLDTYTNTPNITLTKPAYERFTISSWRFRYDDGDEASATWILPANQNVTLETDTTYRIRFLILERYGELAGWRAGRICYLEWRINGAGWNTLPVSGSYAQQSASQLVDLGATTQQLGSGDFWSNDNRGQSEDGTSIGFSNENWPASYEVETEYSFELNSAGSSPNFDYYEFRVRYWWGDSLYPTLIATPLGWVGYEQSLAGSIAAQSTVTGNLELVSGTEWALAGSIAAAGSLTGTIILIQALEGTISAQSTIAGDLEAVRGLEGSVEAQSTLSGELSVTLSLAGTIAAQSTIAAALEAVRGLEGAIEAQSTLSGDLTLQGVQFLAGSIAAQSTLTGGLTATVALSGSLAAQSSLAGSLEAVRGLAGSIAAQSSLAGELSTFLALGGSISATSIMSGDLEAVRGLSGSITSSSTVTGELSLIHSIAGSIAAQSSLVGNLTLEGLEQLEGYIQAQSTLTGDLEVTRGLAGSITAQSTLYGDLSLLGLVELAGSIAAQSTVTGDLSVTRALAGSIAAQSTVAGSLEAIRGLAGAISAQSTLTANLTREALLEGAIAATSQLAGVLNLEQALAGSIVAQSTLSGALSLDMILSGVIEAQSTLYGALGFSNTLEGHIQAQSTLTGTLSDLEELPVWILQIDASNPPLLASTGSRPLKASIDRLSIEVDTELV